MSNEAITKPCRLCGEYGLELCLRLDNMPHDISRLLQESEIAQDRPINLCVYACQSCGFVQLAQTLETTYYDDYLMTATHSPQMQEYQAQQANEFVDGFNLRGKKIIEVGCGDGNFLNWIHKAGAQPSGIEPSARFRREAEKLPYPIHAGYAGRAHPIPGAPYDGFVTRQVLEHVPEPNDFLQGIRRSLVPGAAGLVEVPSLEQALEGRRFYDFFPDHLNYFSARTLRMALERNGFQVHEVVRGMNGEYIVAYVTAQPVPDLSDVQTTVDLLASDIHGFLDRFGKDGKRVAIWGAGGKGLSLLATARVRNVAYVIDSDPHKMGRFTPVSHLPVVGPETLRTSPVDAVIVTALAYREEILRQLRVELNFQGVIALLGPRLEIQEVEMFTR